MRPVHGDGLCMFVCSEMGLGALTLSETLVAEFDLEPCERCGTPFATKAYLDLAKARADNAVGVDIEINVCPECASTVRTEQIAGEIPSF